MLRKHVRWVQSDWDEHVPFLLYVYNNTIHETTKKTPFELWRYRDPPRTPLWWMFPRYGTDGMLDPAASFTETLKKLPEMFREVRYEMGRAQIRQRRNLTARLVRGKRIAQAS